MNNVGIELLSVFGMHPVRFVELAADLGVHNISMGLTSMPPGLNPENYAAWSLRDDAQLRREMIAAMKDRAVSISLGEGVGVRANADVHDSAGDLDCMCELGIKRINAVSLDPDQQRTLDQYSILAEMITARGLEMTMEFGPPLSLATLGAAVDCAR